MDTAKAKNEREVKNTDNKFCNEYNNDCGPLFLHIYL